MRNSVDGPIQDQAVMLAIKHGNWSARQVYRELLRMNGHDPEAEPPTGFPSLRTIQRALQRLNDDTPQGEEWSLLDGSPEDARVVLGYLLAFLNLLQPARRPTRQEAELIVRIAAANPELNETGGLLARCVGSPREGPASARRGLAGSLPAPQGRERRVHLPAARRERRHRRQSARTHVRRNRGPHRTIG